MSSTSKNIIYSHKEDSNSSSTLRNSFSIFLSSEAISSNLGLFSLRLGLAVVMFPHGAQKLLGWFGGYGLEGTGQWMASVGFTPGLLMALALKKPVAAKARPPFKMCRLETEFSNTCSNVCNLYNIYIICILIPGRESSFNIYVDPSTASTVPLGHPHSACIATSP